MNGACGVRGGLAIMRGDQAGKARLAPGPAASVVVPVLDDAPALRVLLQDLRQDSTLQIVVVDGGSRDCSLALARAGADVAISAKPSRGDQLRRGIDAAAGDWLWLLHADSRVPLAALDAFAALRAAPQMARPTAGAWESAAWGWFRVRLDGDGWPLRMIERAMHRRAAWTGIATGDQGIFLQRRLLDAAGGMPRQPLLEDVELCKWLRRLARPRPIGSPIVTSARRWQQGGLIRTVAFMWWLRLRYFAGADPQTLWQRYYAPPRQGEPAR